MRQRFGCFLPPSHSPTKSPHVALKQDIEICCLADELGFDEIWLGEHHSGAWTTLSAPDLLIAAVARETRRIRFATGVIPLPYHHPVHTAERILLLDHLTEGRTILGCGTGSYVHDMEMIGVDPESIRAHFRAALTIIQLLLDGKTVDVSTPWFIAHKAVLQLRPVKDRIEVVVASSLTDDAIAMLTELSVSPSVNLTQPWGVIRPGTNADSVDAVVERIEKYCAATGQEQPVRCNVFVHVADSVSAGIDELLPGWTAQRLDLYRKILGMPIPESATTNRRALESLINAGAFIVGDPESCSRQLTDLGRRLGSTASLMFFVPGWLDHSSARNQLTALAHEVVPALRGHLSGTAESRRLVSSEAGRQIRRRDALIAKDPAIRPTEQARAAT
ncbi:LLM class flavin-dependent oxidoreductase [Mycobacterium sp. MUNTM1]